MYPGVADVYDPDGQPCEHMVVMQRMPDERRLTALLQAGTPVEQAIDDIAGIMAGFHAGADRSEEISQQGSRDALRGRWRDNLDALSQDRQEVLSADLVGEVHRRAEEFLAGRKALFAERIAAGRIVDGHGDLLADDIFCLDDGPRVLDCLDFDDQLLWLDGMDDMACLAMDVEYSGRVAEPATRLLERYAADDPAPPALRHHYVAYRALMRAKVDCVRHGQGDPDGAGHARRHAELALAHLRAGTVRLVLVGGLPGTSKTTLATGPPRRRRVFEV